ncbi:alpha/beta hydrolase [Bordetella genomosp. 12]|uniref:Alpha/beta hydrolase n=1 Tax=Bordetella genomosp. 12 TaxID=463035 RepID=A0A261VCW8_9BORD|nr:alpha/beta hydrolase [Bordetella genomosp. 12]OZI71986.1 alpha/beta hydrolase [Bordetella genomosp. 12]
MDRPYRLRPYPLRTADGQRTLGLLYSQTGKETSVVCLMHPREFSGTPYLVPDILDAGAACWVQAPRAIGNDLRLEHEVALLDVAAALVHLRKLGFTHITLQGTSGGAGLFGFYAQQALRAPERRLSHTPGGRPVKLAEADMPAPDALIFVSPHPGQGKLLMQSLDPSVENESDPFSVLPELDPFSPDNGFSLSTTSATYDADFVRRYRAAQQARVTRLDTLAHQLIATRAAARKDLKQQGDAATADLRRRAAFTPILTLWRTDADLRCWDLKLDPSDRAIGSLWGADPFVSNMGSIAFARLITPESWLSTWSGLSSRASFTQFGGELSLPTLMLEYTGDQAAFPSDMDQIFASLGSTDKTRVKVRGNHHGMALNEAEESGQLIAGRHIQDWLRTHLPTHA